MEIILDSIDRSKFVKKEIFKFLTKIVRFYIRYSPCTLGRELIWKCLIERYNLSWAGHYVTVSTIFGKKLRLTVPDLVQKYLYFFGVWEPYITQYMERNLSPGDTFIDIGANIGYHSILASTLVGDRGKVFAIEASPSNYELLKENIALNNIKNVNMYQVAVHNKQTFLNIYKDKRNIGRNTTCFERAEKRGHSLEAMVRAAPLAEIVGEENTLSARIIKIDVEGDERSVVDGIVGLLSDFSSETEWLIEVDAGPIAKTEDAESII